MARKQQEKKGEKIGYTDCDGTEVCVGDILDISSFGWVYEKTYTVKSVKEFWLGYGYSIDTWENNEGKVKIVGRVATVAGQRE